MIKMKVDKIISSQSNIRELPSRINCPYCNAPIANLAQYKGENYYWIIRGRVMVRKIDKKI